jgi:SAM-dependent methyltransferase
MESLPRINLVVMQPSGYVHSLVFLDTARYFRYQLRLLGAEVLISKNRMRADSLNIVFGAHLGFPTEWCERYAVIFVNLEQLGPLGAALGDSYLNLLRRHAVIDYHRPNVAEYRDTLIQPSGDEVPIVQFHHAPYLTHEVLTPLDQRPLDLLFIGSMNESRRALIDRIEACGVDVAVFDHAVYGPERDSFIQQAKSVINLPFYEAGVFEQVRAFGALSLGTPLISLRRLAPPTVYADAVCWVDEDSMETYFREHFGTPQWFHEAQDCIRRWVSLGSGEANFHSIAKLCSSVWSRMQDGQGARSIWHPSRINLGSGRDYLPGWLNLDVLERAEPDLLLDLSSKVSFPVSLKGRDGSIIELDPDGIDLIYANNVLEHVEDLPALMGNALTLLREGGRFLIEVPYEKAPTAWQDPTHLRALNENSWLYFTDWFWYLGWFENRFELDSLIWLNQSLQPCEKSRAAFMRVELVKSTTSLRERMTARTMQSDFGGVPADEIRVTLS